MKRIIFSLLSAALITGCDNANPPASDAVIHSSKLPITAYGSQPTLNAWPKTNSQSSTALADNLLAANYLILLDGSGSMMDNTCAAGSTKMNAAKTAVNAFASQIPQDANIGLYAFDSSGTHLRVPLATKNRSNFEVELQKITAAGSTPLLSAITDAYQELSNKAAQQLGYGEFHLVIVTDGEASEGENPQPIVASILQDSPVVIHTIGFCISGGHSLNQPGLISYKQANNPDSLRVGLSDILAEAPDFSTQTFDNLQ